jgi:hypothetical protein
MNRMNDQRYYHARAAMSRDQAERAVDSKVAAIHLDMAGRYDDLAGRADAGVSAFLLAPAI